MGPRQNLYAILQAGVPSAVVHYACPLDWLPWHGGAADPVWRDQSGSVPIRQCFL